MKRKLTYLLLVLMPQLLWGQANLEWIKQYTPSVIPDRVSIRKIALDAERNIYSVGEFKGTVDFDPGPGNFYATANGQYVDIYVTKLDSSSNFIWCKQIAGPEFKNIFSLTLDTLNDIIIAGEFSNKLDFDPGVDSFFIDVGQNLSSFTCKLNNDGDFMWAKSFTGDANTSSYCKTTNLVTDNYGNIFSTGNFMDTIDFDPGPALNNLTSTNYSSDVFISLLDSTGNFLWAKQLLGILNDYGGSITLDNEGNLIVTGIFQGTIDLDPNAGVYLLTASGNIDAFILKLDNQGNFIWGGKIGGTSDETIFSAKTDLDGNVYLTGCFKGMVDFDPDTTTVFTMTSMGFSNDIFIMKLSEAGQLLWAKQIGGFGSEYGYDLTLDAFNNVYVTGTFQSGDFDPGADSTLLYATGVSSDIFLVELDSLGNFKWANGFGGKKVDESSSVVVDLFNNIYLGGDFGDTANFSTSGIPYNLFAAGVYDGFVLKLNQTPLGIKDNLAGSTIAYSLFPNPVKEQLTINFDSDVNMQLILRDVLAREVLSKKLYKRTNIDVGYLDNGLYLYEVRNENGIVKTGKLIKN